MKLFKKKKKVHGYTDTLEAIANGKTDKSYSLNDIINNSASMSDVTEQLEKEKYNGFGASVEVNSKNEELNPWQ